jgi:hypothetical protein
METARDQQNMYILRWRNHIRQLQYVPEQSFIFPDFFYSSLYLVVPLRTIASNYKSFRKRTTNISDLQLESHFSIMQDNPQVSGAAQAIWLSDSQITQIAYKVSFSCPPPPSLIPLLLFMSTHSLLQKANMSRWWKGKWNKVICLPTKQNIFLSLRLI